MYGRKQLWSFWTSLITHWTDESYENLSQHSFYSYNFIGRYKTNGVDEMSLKKQDKITKRFEWQYKVLNREMNVLQANCLLMWAMFV
jgi:hypothetical protein